MPIVRLVYFSENQIDPAQGSVVRTLGQILATSQHNNKPVGITGALVFDDQWFIQVLEGERADVWKTFERIKDDDRHSNVVVAEATDAPQRTFANWWMGIATRNAKTETIFAPFLRNGKLQPPDMSGAELLALSIGLAKTGLSRELAPAQAA